MDDPLSAVDAHVAKHLVCLYYCHCISIREERSINDRNSSTSASRSFYQTNSLFWLQINSNSYLISSLSSSLSRVYCE